MTDLAGWRSAVESALTTAGVRTADSWEGEPPYAVMFFDGSSGPQLHDGSRTVDLAIVGVVSKALDDVSMTAVDGLVEDIYGALLDTPGVRINGIDSLTRNAVGVDTMYTVTFRISAMTELGG